MKILLVHDYATLTGGAELSLIQLRDGLRDRGHQVRFFASSAGQEPQGGLADAYCLGTTSRLRTLVQTANPWAHWQLRSMLESFEPDVVHVRMFLTQLSPLILPLLRQIPSVYEACWYRSICPLGTRMLPDKTCCERRAGVACLQSHCVPLHDWLPLMLQLRLWRRWRPVFDRIVANSEAVRQRLLEAGIGPVNVIPLAAPFRPPRPPLAAPPTLGFAGRLVPEKGLDVLLAAFARVVTEMPDARLVVAGDGPDRDQVRASIARYSISQHVALLGHVPPSDMEAGLAGVWVQAVPSLWEEPFGLVAEEAMMRGTAVVASCTGGLLEIVEDGVTGSLVPPGDVNALARAIVQLLRNRDRAESFGRAGREAALTRLGESQYVDGFVHLYESMRVAEASRVG